MWLEHLETEMKHVMFIEILFKFLTEKIITIFHSSLKTDIEPFYSLTCLVNISAAGWNIKILNFVICSHEPTT